MDAHRLSDTATVVSSDGAPALPGRSQAKFSSNASSASVTVNGKTVVACLSHLSGTCVRHDCRYVHLKQDIRMLPSCVCAYYAQGECKKGPHCRYFHGPSEDLKRMKERGYALYNPFTNEAYDSIPAELEDESRGMRSGGYLPHASKFMPHVGSGPYHNVPRGAFALPNFHESLCEHPFGGAPAVHQATFLSSQEQPQMVPQQPTFAFVPPAAPYAFPHHQAQILYQFVGDPNQLAAAVTPLPGQEGGASFPSTTYVIIAPQQSTPPPPTQYVVIQP